MVSIDDRDRDRDTGTLRSPLAWVVAVAGPVVVSLLLVPMRDEIRTSNVSLVFVLVVVAAAVLGGRATAVTAALVSVAAFDLAFTRPYGSFTIAGRDDVETALLLLAVGLVVGELVVRNRRSRERAAESRAEVVRIRRLSELAAGGEPRGRLIGIVQGELVSLLPVRGCRFEPVPTHEPLPELTHQGVRLPGGADPGSRRSGQVALPVFGAGRPYGRFVLEFERGGAGAGITVPPEDRALAVALADQLGTVLANESID